MLWEEDDSQKATLNSYANPGKTLKQEIGKQNKQTIRLKSSSKKKKKKGRAAEFQTYGVTPDRETVR